jgi:hypothetical protein
MKHSIGDYEITIEHDELAESPREWDNLGVIVSASRKHPFGQEYPHSLNPLNFGGFEGLRKAIKSHCNNGIILPIFLLDHSGIAISTLPFNDPWDSGQIGYIYCEERMIRKEYSIPRGEEISEEILEKVKEILRSEIKTLNQFLQGDIYHYTISLNGEILDTRHSIYGEEQALAEAKEMVEYFKNES